MGTPAPLIGSSLQVVGKSPTHLHPLISRGSRIYRRVLQLTASEFISHTVGSRSYRPDVSV